MNIHPQRDAIVAEVHARPFQSMAPPLSVLHVAVLREGTSSENIEQAVLQIASEMGFVVDEKNTGFFFLRNEKQALRYEPHNEFYTLTLYRFGTIEPVAMPESWNELLPGDLLVGVEVMFRESGGEFDSWVSEHFTEELQLCSSLVMNDAARLCTNFHIMPDSGFTRVIIQDIQLRYASAGRLIQRVCEIETYRHTALLALSLARSLMSEITLLDKQLAEITGRTGSDDVATLLNELMALSAKVEEISANTANRFAASEAYFAMVEKRVNELRENRIKGMQMVAEFMDRRLDPARKTCLSAAARVDQLSRRIARVTELIQSQVDLAIEQQNRDLLEAMNKRSRRQLNLQGKLEGLSVIIVAYYLYDLLDLSLKNVLDEGPLLDRILTGMTAALPLIVITLYWVVRRLWKGVDE